MMKILSIGVHADDCEFGLGGTAALLLERGHDVLFVNLKSCARTGAGAVEGGTPLSCKKITLDSDATKCYKNNEESTRALEKIILDYRPDIVFTMHPKDDDAEHAECARTAHEALFAAAVDGIAPNEIYTYECEPNSSSSPFIPDLLIDFLPVEGRLRECITTLSQDRATGERRWEEKKVYASFRGHIISYPLADGLSEGFKILKFPEGNNGFFLLDALKDRFSWNGTKMYYPRGVEFF